MKRWACIIGMMVVFALATFGLARVRVESSAVHLASLAAPAMQAPPNPPSGPSSVLLARHGAIVEMPPQPSPGPFVELLLERVPLDPGNAVDGRDPDESGGGEPAPLTAQAGGMHLLYIETGEVTVATPDEETLYRQGESAFVPAPRFAEIKELGFVPTYELRNNSGECASLLRLSVQFHVGQLGASPSASGGPQRPQRACGEYERLLSNSTDYPLPPGAPPELPFHVFIARLGFDLPIPFSPREPVTGPISVLVESGEASFEVREEDSVGSDVRVTLPPSGAVGVDPQVDFWLRGTSGTTVLLLGIVPTDQDWIDTLDQPGTGAAPLLTPAAITPGTRVTTLDEGVRLRALPTTESPIVAELPEGSELTVTGPPERFPGVTTDWYPVTDAAGRSGYIAGMFIAPVPE